MTLFFTPGELFAGNTNIRKNPFLFSDEEAALERAVAPAPVVKPVTQTRPTPKKIVQKRYFETNSLTVTAILYSPPKSRAIIDGHIISEGDTFAGKKVLKIDAESVIVEETGYKYIVRLAKVGK